MPLNTAKPFGKTTKPVQVPVAAESVVERELSA
jgi:hypothetical protein